MREMLGKAAISVVILISVVASGSGTGLAAARDLGGDRPGVTTFSDAEGNSVTPRESTVLLDEQSLRVLESASTQRLTFASGSFPQAESIRQGSVLIAQWQGRVFMVFALSVSRPGKRLVVEGRPATLPEAYEDLRVRRTIAFTDPPVVRSGEWTSTAAIRKFTRAGHAWTYTFAGDLGGAEDDTNRAGVGLTLSGDFTLEPEITVDVDVRASKYDFRLAATPEVTLSAKAEASFAVQAPMRLADIDFQRKVFTIGPFPVEIHPQLGLDITVAAKGDAGIEAKIIDYEQSLRVGVGYVDGSWRSTSTPLNPLDGLRAPSLTPLASAEASVTLRAELFVNLYELAGPTLAVELIGRVIVEPLEPTWARIEVDVNILVGGRISVLGAEGGPDFSFDIAPELGPWVMWEAKRDPSKVRGVIGFSRATTGLELDGAQCVQAIYRGIPQEDITWTLPDAAVAAGVGIATTDAAPSDGKKVSGSQACFFSSTQNVNTHVSVTSSSSRVELRHSIHVSERIVNPPRRPTKLKATARFEGVTLEWTAAKSPAYWTVTATTDDTRAPEMRRQVTRTLDGSSRSADLLGLASRTDYRIVVSGTNQAGAGAKAAVKARPLGRIRLVGASGRLGSWADVSDDTRVWGLQSQGLMLLSSGKSALAVIPVARISPGSSGFTLARLRLSDGKVEWYPKGAKGIPLPVWSGSTYDHDLAQRSFVANPTGTTVIAIACSETTSSCGNGRFVRVLPQSGQVQDLPQEAQDHLFDLWSQGLNSRGDWTLSADGRYLVTAHNDVVRRWDLKSGSVDTASWSPEECGDERCSEAVHSVGLVGSNRVVVSVGNMQRNAAGETCRNDVDLWLWNISTDSRVLISPTQPTVDSRGNCQGESSFVLPVGAAAASTIAFYEVDSQYRETARLLNLDTQASWQARTFPIYQATWSDHRIGDTQEKLSLSADGNVMAVPVYVKTEEGVVGDILIGVDVCHLTARVCTLALGRRDMALPAFSSALLFGGAQLSADARQVLFVNYLNVSTGWEVQKFAWWRQRLNPVLT